MKQIHFFATRKDILLVLESVERDESLQYVRTGNELNPDFETFLRATDIPNLGVANCETGSVCNSFLVTRTTVPIRARSLKGANGVQRYLMDQLLNPDTVGLTPAGIWGDDIILQGILGTVSDSSISQDLMKKFSAGFKSYFSKIQGRFVGPQALTLLNAGTRLTIAAQSPSSFDLILEH